MELIWFWRSPETLRHWRENRKKART